MKTVRCLRHAGALALAIFATCAAAAAQTQTTSVVRTTPTPRPAPQVRQERTPTEARPPAAQYDIGLIVKRLAALEAQVSDLKAKNAALEAALTKQSMQKESVANAPINPKVTAELQRLDGALRNHTHPLPANLIALSAIPGMQDIANKTGMAAVIQQWQSIKLVWTSGGGLGWTGKADIPVPGGTFK